MSIPAQSGSNGTIDVQFEDDIAILTMKRGENRINESFLNDFNKALDIVESNQNIKALITTGEGKYYSIGLDLDWLQPTLASDENYQTQFSRKFNALNLRLLTFPVPTIAALNGHAYAGGAVMAFTHDYKIMRSDRGWFCLNEVHIRLKFNPFVLELLRHKIGHGQLLSEAAVLGRRYTGPEALEAGVVQVISKGSDVLKDAKQMAKRAIAVGQGGYDRASLKGMKEAVYKSAIDLKNITLRVNVKPSL